MIAAVWVSLQSPLSAGPVTGSFEITAGQFEVLGGFAPLRTQLPNETQGFVEVERILGSDQLSLRISNVLFEPWGPFGSDLSQISSLRQGNIIRFSGPIVWNGQRGQLDYTLESIGETIELDGTVSIARSPYCFDCIYLYRHTDVSATIVAEPATGLLLAFAIVERFIRRRRRWLRSLPKRSSTAHGNDRSHR